MSQENLELVREIIEVFNREDIGEMIAQTHTDFELYVPPGVSAEPDTYRGHEGMRRYWESFQDVMDEIRIHVEQLEDAGDSVVVAMCLNARGRSTGIAVEQHVVGLWAIRDGRLMSIHMFASLAEAREAAAIG